ncbi:MAG: DnaJ domain-containing protein [Dehalococcoidia bacterium]|nr:DnaJ domain-containing protein [Dehalococcoidia bacterium]
MSNLPDFYAELQVDPKAEKEIIEAAYRKLAGKYHPDVSKSPDAVQRMKSINAAYEVLSDPYRRAAYDTARSGQGSAPFHPSSWTPVWQWDINKIWRSWIRIPLVLVAITILALRFSPRVGLFLAACLAIVWLYVTLTKPRQR